ncbi:MAG TPA: hypothetical protein VN154_13535 [Rhizomicrobium sp.]|nr:hypothetical protein [Rhizomicrobium sp.]
MDIPTLVSRENQFLPAPSGPADRMFQNAQITSAANFSLSNNLDPIDIIGNQAGATGGLFRSAALATSPYVLLSNGGNYFSSTFALSDDVHASIGGFAIDPNRPNFGAPGFSYLNQIQGQEAYDGLGQSQTGVVGVNWDFTNWGTLGLIATQTAEQNGALRASDPFSAVGSANLSTVGMTARVGFGDGWVTTLSYNEGLAQLELQPNAVLFNPSDSLRSRSYGFAVAKHGLFDSNDSLGVALTRPLQVYSGAAEFTSDPLASSLTDLKFDRQFSNLSGTTQETDFELGYVTTFMGGAIALQANAGYQVNVDGLGGTNALTVVSRAKINF